MKKTKTRTWEALAHLIFWALAYWLLIQAFAQLRIEKVDVNGVAESSIEVYYFYVPVAIGLIIKIVLVYINLFFLLPKFLTQNKGWKYLILNILLLTLCTFTEFGINEYLESGNPENEHMMHYAGLQTRAALNITFLGLTMGLFLGKKYFQNEKQRQILSEQKLDTELQFLKSQINPHFLFNTLNNLFSMAEVSKNKELSKGISELSNLMRYMLDEATENEVPLTKEVDYLKSVIGIKQLQLLETDDVEITFEVSGHIENMSVAPLILAPFVENALKHGIDHKKRSIVNIGLETSKNQIVFKVSNTKSEQYRNGLMRHSGIGLENVKRRLELIYPERFHLELDDQQDWFKVLLKINLLADD